MPTIKCKFCLKEFYAKQSWLNKGYGIYCSSVCQYKGRKTGKNIACYICGKETYKQLKSIKNSKSGNFFCNKSCQAIWRNQEFIGAKHANWKDGLYAYKSVLLRNKVAKVCTLCKIKDKRVLAVHHIDKNRKNNLVSNLAWLCHNCHHLVHYHKEEEKNFKEKFMEVR
jgi:hypothetical protein